MSTREPYAASILGHAEALIRTLEQAAEELPADRREKLAEEIAGLRIGDINHVCRELHYSWESVFRLAVAAENLLAVLPAGKKAAGGPKLRIREAELTAAVRRIYVRA